MLNLAYPEILKLFPQYHADGRADSASFLMWYLENYYRLDETESVDSVCDQPGDRGVDGIFVNDNDQTITIFQSRVYQGKDTNVGDAPLRSLAGTLTQFETAEKIQALIKSAGDAKVAALAKRLDLVNKIGDYELRAEFISNVDLHPNGADFLKSTPDVVFVGKTALISTYISDTREVPVHAPVTFDVTGYALTQYTVDENTMALIAPIKATELVKMSGLADQSLFDFNVRGPLGKTSINRAIVNSIRDQSRHKLFPLFHNGITVIAKEMTVTSDTLTVSNYFVVNGCQSLTALFDNKQKLTDNLRVLTKFVLTEPTSDLAEMVTRYSNTQNGVRPRDFKANHPMQIRLQAECSKYYDGEYVLEIKRGEVRGTGYVVSNEIAGLLLMAFDLKEPWATHRSYQVFEDKYAAVFGRPEVTADRIVLCQVISEVIEEALPKIENQLFARYRLTRYFMIYIIRNILETDDLAPALMTSPESFVRDEGAREHFRACIRNIVGDLIIDLNAEIKEYGEDFDYRDKLRDQQWVEKMSRKIAGDHQKLIQRMRLSSFRDDWENTSEAVGA